MNATNTTGQLLLITGVSSGFGRAFAIAALAAGHRVVGTVRNENARREFENLHPERSHTILLDLTRPEGIDAAIREVESIHGSIDVLINNAGYGHEGVLEESPLEEMRQQFEVNVFGAVAMMKAVLPGMRQRRAGRIINVTSMGGFITMPGISYYCGSKFALEGISEVVAQEVKSFGVHVTAIAPGSFRTDWAGRSMVRSKRCISDYDSLFEPIRLAREQKSGTQTGDPAKAAAIVMKIIADPSPPVHLLLGKDAVKLVRDKISSLSNEIDQWEQISCSTDFVESPFPVEFEFDSLPSRR